MLGKKRNWIGFDLGGTKMSAVVLNSEWKILGEEKQKTKAREGIEKGFEKITDTLEKAMKKAGIEASSLGGIGIGFPGAIDYEKGVILSSPNLGWESLSVRKRLSRKMGCPVVLLNDVDAGIFGEYCFGAGRKARCVVGIFVGTGVGGGAVLEGKILRGKKYSCFEIGHMPVLPGGPLCGCGQRGCLEALSSRLAISAAAAQAAYRGQAPCLLKTCGMDLSNIRSSALAESVRAGDKAVGNIIRNAASWIGTAAAGIIHLLLPDVIVLGGGVVEAMPRIFCEEVQKEALKKVLPVYSRTFKVVPAKLGDYAGLMGAAAWAYSLFSGKEGVYAK